MIILFISPYYVTRTPNNGSAVYTGHVIQTEKRDHYTHYHWWEFWWRKNYKIIIGANQFLWDVFVIRSVVYLLNMICLNLLFLYKIVYIWIFVQIWHSFLSICRDRNPRYNFYGSQSRAKVIRLQPIPPFVFPFYFLFSIFYFYFLFSISNFYFLQSLQIHMFKIKAHSPQIVIFFYHLCNLIDR